MEEEEEEKEEVEKEYGEEGKEEKVGATHHIEVGLADDSHPQVVEAAGQEGSEGRGKGHGSVPGGRRMIRRRGNR